MLKYRLKNNSLNDIHNPAKTILLNRGVIDWEGYLNISEECVNDHSLLKNMNEAVENVAQHISNNHNIHIIVDSDVDGYTSASMLYRYFKHYNNELNVTYSLHTKKQHGLSYDVEIPDNCELLIVPDAGSNDIEQCKKLNKKHVDVVILDHHICDTENNYAIVVNNQMCDYPNKNFCGAGIVYKFLQALDEELWDNYAEELVDMMALGNISDVMDMREFETKYLVEKGLSKIRSKLFKALIEKQSYSMNGVVNITSVQFYITPILNAMIRVGKQEEKELLFRAFIETDETFKYKKRGETEEIDEDIYTRAARLCSNAKARQAKEVQKSVDALEEIIETSNLNSNKVLFVDATNILNETLTGLVAMKLSDKYSKPCVLLRKQKRDDGEYYGGSCRNFDNSPILSLKELLDGTNEFEFVQGHENAAGVSILAKNVKNAIMKINASLKTLDFQGFFEVDFSIFANEITVSFIKGIDDIKDIFGQGIKEPLIHIKEIPVYSNDVMLMGKELNSWKIYDNEEGIAYVKFNVDTSTDELIRAYQSTDDDDLENGCLLGYMDVIATASMNNYKGILTPQFIIKDYEFREV